MNDVRGIQVRADDVHTSVVTLAMCEIDGERVLKVQNDHVENIQIFDYGSKEEGTR